ncbi:hypothetical protein [Candidatus Marinarcus aquaticus]|uniref:Uncharacterized protein n=1 Tax=Candidatus Marinarcus aquaticus TaxID=2044504 RepID=A0A4Q0XNK4_9BACT|nr:hypothetical protein [Candidatus Marinarcus aquaticus]RXJ56271.1 hypothetical protein CRV04_09515 [Candidatus Marinarcus aquaticus]
MKSLLIFLSLFFVAQAQKDFYYSYIDSSGAQIKSQEKQEMKDGYATLENIKKIARDDNLEEAYKRLLSFKGRNNLTLLNSDIILLESEFLLKKRLKSFAVKGAKYLEDSINSSAIAEEDLPRAYMLLVELKLAANKPDDARYFVDVIINNFDTPIINAYGKIYLAKLYEYKKEYKKAIKVLYEVLTKTTNIDVATVVADELFDVYILDDQKPEAYKLAKQVLNKNMDYYANDSFLAITKVKKLIKSDMPEFAAQILEALLERTKNLESIETFKFELAETYMLMYDGTMKYLNKAKELYKDVLNDYPDGRYTQQAKMIIDEILMREGKIEPAVLNSKYYESASMQQKVLMQEIVNAMKKEQYELILRSQKVYKKISDTIFNRFGYKNLEDVLDKVRVLLIKQYLIENKCNDLNAALNKTRKETMVKLIEDDFLKYKFFECLLEYPNEKGYNMAKEGLFNSRDAQVYTYLERVAYKLGDYEEALDFSQKVEMLNDQEASQKEFLYRFQVLNALQNPLRMRRFFNYAFQNPLLIENNQDNPLILDFYYQYYFYLLDMNETAQANTILNELYEKQKEYKAFIYSPSIEIELAKRAKENQNYLKAIAYLQESITNTRRIKNNELAQVYYEMIKLYELTNNQTKKDEVLQQCKALDPATTTSLYKKMCDEM